MMSNKKNYPEIDEIKEDLDSLKDNVVGLTKHVTKDSKRAGEKLTSRFMDRLAGMKEKGKIEAAKVEGRVRAKPAQSLAIAFVSGLAISALLKRR